MAGTLLPLIRLGRFRFLLGGLVLCIFGALLAGVAGHPIDPVRLLFGWTILAAGQLSVSYSNDYFDRAADRAGTRTRISGGSGVLLERPDLARAARQIALALIGASLLLALVHAALYPVPPYFLPFVVAGNLVGWYYTAPPLAFAYRGLGEAATALTFGFFMPGTGYLVVAGGLDLFFVARTIPLLLFGLGFIITVETPDREGDAVAGKMTFVVRHGRRTAFLAVLVAFSAGALLLFTLLPVPGIGLASLLPVATAAAACLWPQSGRDEMVAAAARNLAALAAFILLADIALAARP
jgi:1,4-dihydroxy-2-naphthoate octaprenyltransferase